MPRYASRVIAPLTVFDGVRDAALPFVDLKPIVRGRSITDARVAPFRRSVSFRQSLANGA